MFLSIQWKSKGSKTFQSTVFFSFFCSTEESFCQNFHPKMKILSFTHPHVVPNLYAFISSLGRKKRRMLECWKANSFSSPRLVVFFCSMEIYENQWEPKLFAYQHSSKCLLLCSTEQSYTGLEQHEAYTTYTTWVNNRIFKFWVNCPFKPYINEILFW